MLTLDKIYHAKFVLKKVARKTDLIAAPRLCPGTDLYLKTENLQVTVTLHPIEATEPAYEKSEDGENSAEERGEA